MLVTHRNTIVAVLGAVFFHSVLALANETSRVPRSAVGNTATQASGSSDGGTAPIGNTSSVGGFPSDAPLREDVIFSDGAGSGESPTGVLTDNGGFNPPGCETSDCRDIYTGFQISPNFAFPVRVESGVRVTQGGAHPVVKVGASVLSIQNSKAGDLTVVPLEVTTIPGSQNLRIRFSLAESDVLLFCKRKGTGKQEGPGAGWLDSDENPTCEVERWAIGGQLVHGQYDVLEQRFGARWAEIKGIINFFTNGNRPDHP